MVSASVAWEPCFRSIVEKKGLDVGREERTGVARVRLPPSRHREEVETLRRRDQRERQRPLLMVLCLALAVAAFTGAGLLREFRGFGVAAESGRGPSPKH